MIEYLRVLDKPHTGDFSSAPYEPGFPLDSFQRHAIEGIQKNENVLVTAHTGSGKTVPAIFGIADSLQKNKKIIYTSPIKSLSNQKFFELSQKFPDVGILTGDIKYNPDAQCVIMTTEILRNILYQKQSTHIDIEEVDKVIFDEVHYINDPDRGKVWEECFILMPSRITLIMLSATIDKAAQFASWIGEIKQKVTRLIPTTHRVVPLEHFFYTPFDDSQHELTKIVSSKGEFTNYNEIRQNYKKLQISKMINPFLKFLTEHRLVPALFFIFSRKECERLAKSVHRSLVTSEEIAEIVSIFDFEMRNHKETYQSSPQYHEVRALVQKGIGYHHSGLVPVLKEVTEILFAKGLIKVLFATETFAVGVNMPTKTVIFPKLSKYSNGDFRYLRTDEYLQMAGRAGRRGLDKFGTVIILPTDELLPQPTIKSMMLGKSPSIESKFRLSYQFILKILRNDDPTLNIADFMGKSLLEVDNGNSIKNLEVQKIKSEADNRLIIPNDQLPAIMEYHEAYLNASKLRQNQYRKELARLNRVKQDIPNFEKNYKAYTEYLDKAGDICRIQEGINQLETYLNADTEKVMDYLSDNNYIDNSEPENPKILVRGILASEISECNEIILTELLLSDILDPLTAPEIVAVLATFIPEKSIEDTTLKTLSVPDHIKQAICNLEYGAQSFEDYEDQMKISIGTDWKLHLGFVEPAFYWASGHDILEVHKKCEIFEGSFIRNILRINNIVDNVKTLAEHINKPHLLERLDSIERIIVRDQVTTDSLYISKSTRK